MGGLYHLATNAFVFSFSAEEIQQKNFPSKVYPWSSFSNVILKDDVLTLDLKNNKIIQGEIENDTNVSEGDFNNFAQAQLTKEGYSIS